MKCEKFSRLMTDCLANEISPADKQRLENHISSCESCAREFEELKNAWSLTEKAFKTDSLAEATGLEPEQYNKIFKAAEEFAKKPSFFSMQFKFSWLEAAASFVILALLAGMLLPAFNKLSVKKCMIIEQLGGGADEAPRGGLGLQISSKESPASVSQRVKEQLKRNVVCATLEEERTKESTVEVEVQPEPKVEDFYGDANKVAEFNYLPEKAKKTMFSDQRGLQIKSREEGEAGRLRQDKIRASGDYVSTEKSEERMSIKDFSNGKLRKNEEDDESTKDYFAFAAVDKVKQLEARKPVLGREGKFIIAGKQPSEHAGEKGTPEFAPGKVAQEPEEIAEEAEADVDSDSSETIPPDIAGTEGFDKKSAYKREIPVSQLSISQTGTKEKRDKLELSELKEIKEEKPVSGVTTTPEPLIPAVTLVLDEIEEKTFFLNLKLWDITDARSVREYLNRKDAAFPDTAQITVDKEKGTIKIAATKEKLERVEEIFSELRKSEERLKEHKDGLPFIDTKQKPVSTFSIDVDTASYTLARKQLRQGHKPEPESVRPEEFINYFDYHYRSPENATFGVYLETAPSPFRAQNYVMRVGIQARRMGSDLNRSSVFTILIDTSGSMAKEDRIGLLKKTIPLFLDQLKPDDKVAVMTCGWRTDMITGGYLPAERKKEVIEKVKEITAEGITNLETGLLVAYHYAQENYVAGAYNRVILFTDGIANIGSNSAEEILGQVESSRRKGISNTIIALGGDGDDVFLEALANKGDGNYVFIEDEESAEEIFVDQFAARFREIARDVKIQVEFNPMIVSEYRQIGYENRQLSKADFRNDKVDAGEVGAGQSVTALYELKLNNVIIATEEGEMIYPANIATVRLRYRRADTMDIEEKEFYADHGASKFRYDDAEPGFKLAVNVAEFAENLCYPDTPGIANPAAIMKELNDLASGEYRNDFKVKELYFLVKGIK